MKAFVTPDPTSQIVEPAEVDVPEIAADELLVRLHAVGVGIHDSYFLPSDAHYPYTVGIEGAGTIAQVGEEVTGYRPGERIAFVSSMQAKGGTWAEYAAVRSASLILPIPEGLDFAQAAVLPVAGNTAVRAIAQLQDLPEGSSVFIAGGAGAIGTLAVQLARARGWRVAASASAHNHAYLHSLGADLAVDYHGAHWSQEVRDWATDGVAAALAVHPDTSADALSVVRDGGTVITISGDRVEPVRGIEVAQLAYELDVRDELTALMGAAAAGEVHLEIERVHPFAEALEALDRVRTRHVRGKLVLSLDEVG